MQIACQLGSRMSDVNSSGQFFYPSADFSMDANGLRKIKQKCDSNRDLLCLEFKIWDFMGLFTYLQQQSNDRH